MLVAFVIRGGLSLSRRREVCKYIDKSVIDSASCVCKYIQSRTSEMKRYSAAWANCLLENRHYYDFVARIFAALRNYAGFLCASHRKLVEYTYI